MAPLTPESPLARPASPFTRWLIAFGLLAFGLKAWTCFCLFPAHAWNDVRLRPSFLIADGIPLYPGLNEGVISTWIYGPAHPLFFLPVTLLRNIQSVYLAAGVLNIFQLVAALTFACWFWPSAPSAPRPVSQSMLVLVVCLLLIPDVFLTIIQADNTCLVFGLLSVTCLARNAVSPSSASLVGAAFFGVGAAFAKLHGAAILAGELLWLGLFLGPRRARDLFVAALASAVIWCLATLPLAASPAAIWAQVVRLPAKLPWATNLTEKLVVLGPPLLLMVLLPGLMIVAAYRRKLVSRLAWLPILVWLLSLPLGVLGALKIGGSGNSLHGVFYLLPFFFIELGTVSETALPRFARWLGLVTLLGLGVFHVVAAARQLPRAPFLVETKQAEQMATHRPDSVWMPWRPLATYLATGKVYHDEDGLFVRQLTGLYPRRSHAYAGLPAQWSMTAIEIPGMDWGIARVMQPEQGAQVIKGAWHIYSFHPVGGN